MNEAESTVRRGIADVRGVQIAYEDIGQPTAPPIVLVMGFACQLIAWPDEFCERLTSAGYRVIRFDNRDIGLSSKIRGRVDGALVPRMARYFFGRPSSVPYTLVDMATDTVGLLDHLDIGAAHLVGASMGGMISQIVASEHAERVRSLGIMFSTTNQALMPPPHPLALAGLLASPGKNPTRDQVLDMMVRSTKAFASPAYPQSDDVIREGAAIGYDRSYHPAGVVRQLAAAMGTGSLLRYSRRIATPTVVLHGAADRLIRPSGGRAIARAVPGAKLHLLDGWGHDIPTELYDRITGLLLDNIRRAA